MPVMGVRVSGLSISVDVCQWCVPMCVCDGYLHVSALLWICISCGMYVCQHVVCVCQPCVYICVSMTCVYMCQPCVHGCQYQVCICECARDSVLCICVDVCQPWVQTFVSVEHKFVSVERTYVSTVCACMSWYWKYVCVSVLRVYVSALTHRRTSVCACVSAPSSPALYLGGGYKEGLPRTLGLSLGPQCSWRLRPSSPCPHPNLSLTGTRVNKCCFSPILLRPVMENPRAGSEPRIDSPFHLTGWLSP